MALIENNFATEAHGKTRKNKSLTINNSVFFRVLPWPIEGFYCWHNLKVKNHPGNSNKPIT